MRFRRFGVSYWSMQILCLFCALGAVWGLRICDYDMAALWLFGGIGVGMLLLCIFNPWNEKLQIDDSGISCFRRKRMLWSLSWTEIGQIHSVPVHRCRGYQIVPKYAPESKGMAPDYTFEHSRRIRDALEKYGAACMGGCQ